MNWSLTCNIRLQILPELFENFSWGLLVIVGTLWTIPRCLLCHLFLSGLSLLLSLPLPLRGSHLPVGTILSRQGALQRPPHRSTIPWPLRFLLVLNFVFVWQLHFEDQWRRTKFEQRGLGRLDTGLGTPWREGSESHDRLWQSHRQTGVASPWF